MHIRRARDLSVTRVRTYAVLSMPSPSSNRDLAGIATALSGAALLAAGLLGFVFPRVITQWANSGQTISAYARLMVRAIDFVNHYGVVIFPVLVAVLIYSIIVWRRGRPEGQHRG